MEINARDAQIRFGGRLHSQFATSSADGGKSTDFFTRRARLTIDVRVTPLLDARVQPDFGGGELELKDAYFRLNFDRAFRLSMGQFKRAFDVFELNSSTDIVVVERTGRIDGVGGCSGPGGTCTLSRFTGEARVFGPGHRGEVGRFPWRTGQLHGHAHQRDGHIGLGREFGQVGLPAG